MLIEITDLDKQLTNLLAKRQIHVYHGLQKSFRVDQRRSGINGLP